MKMKIMEVSATFKYNVELLLERIKYHFYVIPENPNDYNLPATFNFVLSRDNINNTYFVESVDHPRVYGVGNNIKEAVTNFRSAYFHEFGVPKIAAKKLQNKFINEKRFVDLVTKKENTQEEFTFRSKFAPA